MLDELWGNYRSLGRDLCDYWRYFGTPFAIILSPYMHVAFVFSFFYFFCSGNAKDWTDAAVATIPSILGFSLTGYAVIVSFGGREFVRFLSRPRGKERNNLFLVITATFLHLVIFQVVSLLIAIFIKKTGFGGLVLSFFGATTYFYSIMLCVAAVFEVKTLSKWYSAFSRKSMNNGIHLKKSKSEKRSIQFRHRRVLPRFALRAKR